MSASAHEPEYTPIGWEPDPNPQGESEPEATPSEPQPKPDPTQVSPESEADPQSDEPVQLSPTQAWVGVGGQIRDRESPWAKWQPRHWLILATLVMLWVLMVVAVLKG